MSSPVQGNSCILKVFLAGDYLTVVCTKSFTLTVTSEVIETTTKGTGQFKTYDYNGISYTVSLDGILKFTDPLVENGIMDLLNTQLGFIELSFKLYYTNPEGTVKILSGTAIITQTVITAAASQNVGGTVEFQGSGPFTIDAPDADCAIVITGDGLSVITPGSLYNFHPATTGGTPSRLDWALDGGAFNTALTDNFNVAMGYGAHHITIIPYCSSGLPGTQFDEDFVISSPP